ncbi:MAG: hypothetical protein JOZ18_06755, partial [Chloroflexi bacterium]|nr:hypothetical protein [Chloroflexota bacterium]
MRVAVAEEPRVLHTIQGRVRVHLPGWSGQGKRSIETVLREVPGVRSIQAKPLTGNILIHFDPLLTNEPTILAVVRTLDLHTTEPSEEEPPPP